jgi:autotransporter-associated beta strand protein
MLKNQRIGRRSRWIWFAAGAVVAGLSPARGADDTWTGRGVNDNYTTPENWSRGEPANNDSLIFDGVTRLMPRNTFTPDRTFSGITFAPTAGEFNLVGFGIVLSGNIIDQRGFQGILQSIRLNVPLNVDVVENGQVSLAGVISESASGFGLNKTGLGTLVLTAGNSFTGTTLVHGGTLKLDFGLNAPLTDVLYNGVVSGPRVLSLGDPASPAGVRNPVIFAMSGNGFYSTSQSFNSVNVGAGKSVIQLLGSPGGPLATLDLGTLTHTTGASVMVLQTGTRIITAPGTPLINGIIGGWALASSTAANLTAQPNTFATLDASGDVLPYDGYTTYTLANDTASVMLASAGFANKNVRVVGTSHTAISVQVDAPGAGSTTELNTVSFRGANAASSAGDTLYIGAGNTLRLGKYGAIFSQETFNSFNAYVGGTGDVVQFSNGTAGSQDVGTLTAGGAPDTAGELHFIATGSRLIVEAKITDNGSGPVTVVKTGVQGLKLDGHNTYSGGTYINDGLVQLAGNEVGTSNGDGLGTGPVYVMPGTQVYLSAPATTVANNFFIAGVGTSAENFGAIRGPLGSGLATLTGTITLMRDARLASVGANGANAGLRFQGRITDDGNRRSPTFGDGGFMVGATGVVSFANPTPNDNDWGGDTILGFGDVYLGASEQIPHGPGKGNLVFNATNGGTYVQFHLRGQNETINGLTQAGSPTNNNYWIENGSSNTVSTLTVGAGDATASFRGRIIAGSGTLSLVKTGAGTQTLTGLNSYTGTTTVNGGKLVMTQTYSGGSGVEIADGASLDLPHNSSTPNNVVLKTPAVNTHTSGRLNISDNKLVVTGGDVGSWNGTNYTGVTGLIASGHNPGNWSGGGIVTTQTAAITGNLTSIGIATADQAGRAGGTFGGPAGVSVASGDVLVMYTYGGDANLDGKLNIDDYSRIDLNVNLGISGWYNGDFNYDGKINVDDYGIIDTNIGLQGAPFPTGPEVAAAPRVARLSSVPEPHTTALALLTLTSLAARRSRRVT